jgi:hypothetical protein
MPCLPFDTNKHTAVTGPRQYDARWLESVLATYGLVDTAE